MEGQNIMRKANIIIRLLLVIAASIYVINNAKGCDHLWNLLASRKGIEPTTWSWKEYRKEATDVAKSLGMVYDRTAVGNEAIVAALCTETLSMEEEGQGAPIGEAIACTPVIHQFVEDWTNFSIVFNVHMGPDTIVSTDTIWHWTPIIVDSVLVSPFENNRPCIEAPNAIQTPAVAACELCDKAIESSSIRERWNIYMAMKDLKWSEFDKATKVRMRACRQEVGRIVRPYHLTVHPSAGGQTGLSQARSNKFWKSVGGAFKSIGACKRS